MTDKISAVSRGFAVSVPGAGHIRYATPCQDASGTVLAPRPATIVCDGRGSAKLSHLGAQGAVRAFFSQISVLEPFLAGVLDHDTSSEKWTELCRLLYRTLLQVKLDLAAEMGGEEKDYDFTVAFAVAGSVSIGCFQVGDGAIVLRQGGICQTAFAPDKGEFANQTQFLRPGGDAAGKFHARLFPAEGNEGVAITSDGPEYLMFHLPKMEPGPIFGKILDDLVAGELCEQDLRDYLTRSVWVADQRGADDRSIAVLLPVVTPNPETNSSIRKERPTGLGYAETDDRPMEPEDGTSDCESLKITECRRAPSRKALPALIAASFLMAFILIALGICKNTRVLTDPGMENSTMQGNSGPDPTSLTADSELVAMELPPLRSERKQPSVFNLKSGGESCQCLVPVSPWLSGALGVERHLALGGE